MKTTVTRDELAAMERSGWQVTEWVSHTGRLMVNVVHRPTRKPRTLGVRL